MSLRLIIIVLALICAFPLAHAEMAEVPAGCFMMGDFKGDHYEGYEREYTVHEVCLGAFKLDRYEVTQRDYQRVTGKNPAQFKECGLDCPVEGVSWYDADKYCKKIGGRLPTEAEWEYAARSGGKDERWAGTDLQSELAEYAWFQGTHDYGVRPVGKKKPNALGLYDMSGNLAEWTADWYSPDYYKQSPRDNPKGPVIEKPGKADSKVLRGGHYHSIPRDLRTISANYDVPRDGDVIYGFRCAK